MIVCPGDGSGPAVLGTGEGEGVGVVGRVRGRGEGHVGIDPANQRRERLSGDAVTEETVLRLKHMIVSHHGRYEHGSPKLPMTLEAVALHFLDNLDAKMQEHIIQKTKNMI